MPADDGGPLPADALLQPRAGEDDIAGDHEPKGVIADERDIDKDADDPKNHQHERDDKSKAHLQPPVHIRRWDTGRRLASISRVEARKL